MLDDTKRWNIVHKRTHEEGDDGHSVYAEEKENLFPRGSVVCELGGGTGDDALYFLRKGHSVILFDISDFALKVAQKKAKNEGLEKGLIVRQVDFGLHELPLNNDSVDVAYSRISLNYFPTEETVGIFSAIFKSLKQGGTAYVTLKSQDDEEEMEYLRESAVEYEPGVFIENGQLRSRFSVEELKDMLAKAGISNYQVNSYREQLGPDKKDHRQVLLLNEIVFTK
jgi:ubiquinone/menaquinone biosynthesis C-methylase UbiE